jgi:hypothetical protein
MAKESVEADSGHLDIIRVAGPAASLESLTPGFLESSIWSIAGDPGWES